METYITRPFDQDPRRKQPLKDAVDAVREEGDLEAVVAIVGGEKAQQAARSGHLPELVESLNGHA